jgi:hypothetical protein
VLGLALPAGARARERIPRLTIGGDRMSLTSELINMDYADRLAYLAQFANPTHLTLACGHVVPNVVGTVTYNYYDGEWDSVRNANARPDVDTSGALPNGVTYWFSNVDNSRSICAECGKERIGRAKR